MTQIVDRRNAKDRSAGDRKKFIDRYKDFIRENVTKSAASRKITDMNKSGIKINLRGITEPSITYDPNKGDWSNIISRNRKYKKGDMIPFPESSAKGGGAGNSRSAGEDAFSFELSKEEFFDIYFENMCLPAHIKKSLIDSDKFIIKRHGYAKEGSPTRLNLRKTMERSIARRLANGDDIFLDDSDLIYNHLEKQPEKIAKAVMFCVLDVSGSMTATLKDLAKRFFLLLYLFLTKSYTHIEIRFIRHTTEAEEVDEQTFFYDRQNGGTEIISGLRKVHEIITEEYDPTEYNIYMAQISDGDDWSPVEAAAFLEQTLLPLLQFGCYIEVIDMENDFKWSSGGKTIMSYFKEIAETHQNFKVDTITRPDQIYPVLKELFHE